MKPFRSIVTRALASAALFGATQAAAFPVGERRLITVDQTATLRDAGHSPRVRVTVWYPAAEDAVEKRIDIGPPDAPIFRVGAAAPGAPFADQKRRPVVLLSHGYGGSARMMGWFGTALARHGYVVVAVDHPGNNGIDPMTVAGALLNWDRPEDLWVALTAALGDPAIGVHMDPTRFGVAGFSAGGFSALVAAGARVDIGQLRTFCRAHPADGVCAPQKEFAVTQADMEKALVSPELAEEAAHAGDDHTLPGIKAAFAMAPAIVQALTTDSLAHIKTPVAIILGDVDPVAPPATNGLTAARDIPGAALKVLPGVGHYDFLAECAAAGVAARPSICPTRQPQSTTHQAAIDMATELFDRVLGHP